MLDKIVTLLLTLFVCVPMALWAALQFFLLPLNLLSLHKVRYPAVDVFFAVSVLVIVAGCAVFLIQREYLIALATLCVGFSLSAFYISFPRLFNLERDMSNDGMILLGTPAACLWMIAAGILFSLVKTSIVSKVVSWGLIGVGAIGYMLSVL